MATAAHSAATRRVVFAIDGVLLGAGDAAFLHATETVEAHLEHVLTRAGATVVPRPW